MIGMFDKMYLKGLKMSNMKDYTKISIAKNLHELIKEICDTTGVKMYFLENQAIKEYVVRNYPEFAKKLNEEA